MPFSRIQSSTSGSTALEISPRLFSFTMPSATPEYVIHKFTSTLDIPDPVWVALRTHECNANVILPHLEECRYAEQHGSSLHPQQAWICCMTPHCDGPPAVDFVLSCTHGPLGPYPIFIVVTSKDILPQESIYRRLQSMAFALQTTVPTSRVFSIFAPETITNIFATIWTNYTTVRLDPTPEYYAARISFCTSTTYLDRQIPSCDLYYGLRPAIAPDIPQVAQLCHGFAAESVSISMNRCEERF